MSFEIKKNVYTDESDYDYETCCHERMDNLGFILRSGLAGEVTSSEQEETTVNFVIAALRVFSKDAVITACNYVQGCEREEVTGLDMHKALKYQARMFFEQNDSSLNQRILKELEEMEEESSESTDDTEGADEGIENDEHMRGGSEGEEEEEEEETAETESSEESGETKVEEMTPDQQKRLVVHVNTIFDTWPLWNPDDPVHLLIKRAIDSTPTPAEDDDS